MRNVLYQFIAITIIFTCFISCKSNRVVSADTKSGNIPDSLSVLVKELKSIHANLPHIDIAGNEYLTYNGKDYPIIGYAEEKNRGQAVVLVAGRSGIADFAPDASIRNTSRSISETVTISAGKYVGAWGAWYIVTQDNWTSRFNVYITAPWKGITPE